MLILLWFFDVTKIEVYIFILIMAKEPRHMQLWQLLLLFLADDYALNVETHL